MFLPSYRLSQTKRGKPERAGRLLSFLFNGAAENRVLHADLLMPEKNGTLQRHGRPDPTQDLKSLTYTRAVAKRPARCGA